MQERESEQKRQVVKDIRRFIPNGMRVAMAIGFIGISAFACNPSKDTPTDEPTPRSATGTPIPDGTPTIVFDTPTPTFDSAPTPESQFGGWLVGQHLIVKIDKEGLPKSYVLMIKGHEEFLLERKKMQQLRERAIQTGEPEIIAVTPSAFTPDRARKIIRDLGGFWDIEPKDSLQHPTLSELPKDVLSEEELAEKGVKIIQSDNTSLHIRRAAFEEESPLSNFNKTGKELTIVLVNGPTVSKVFMGDPKYDDVRELIGEEENLEDWIKSIMPIEIDLVRQAIDINRKEIQELVNSGRELSDQETQEVQKAMDNILILKAEVHASDNDLFTGEQLVWYTKSQSGPKALTAKDEEGNSTIFFAVGDIDLSPFHKDVLYFDPNGDFKINTNLVTPPLPGIYPTASSSPKDGQSHLNLIKLGVQKDNSFIPTSPILIQAPGVNLRVELDGNLEVASKRLIVAWEKWLQSGYTDNSGYHFVFSLPEGGYILTKNESSSSSPASSNL